MPRTFSASLRRRFLGRAVDFGDQRLQNRRAGRHLGHGDARAVFRGDGGDARADALGDVVALCFAFALADEVHLDVGDVRAAAHEIMAHEAVEIKRRRDSGIDLVVGDFRFVAHGGGDFRAACAVRSSALPSGMFRMIWNSLLLSNGSIFTFTQPMPTSAIAPSSRAHDRQRETPSASARARAAAP